MEYAARKKRLFEAVMNPDTTVARSDALIQAYVKLIHNEQHGELQNYDCPHCRSEFIQVYHETDSGHKSIIIKVPLHLAKRVFDGFNDHRIKQAITDVYAWSEVDKPHTVYIGGSTHAEAAEAETTEFEAIGDESTQPSESATGS